MFLSVIGRGGPPPSSPWVSFTAVVSVLSKFLDASRMSLIKKTFDDFRVYVFVNSINARFYFGSNVGFIVPEREDSERSTGSEDETSGW